MQEISIMIGSKTGYGISRAGIMISRLFNRPGDRIYFYNDFPTLVKKEERNAKLQEVLEKLI